MKSAKQRRLLRKSKLKLRRQMSQKKRNKMQNDFTILNNCCVS